MKSCGYIPNTWKISGFVGGSLTKSINNKISHQWNVITNESGKPDSGDPWLIFVTCWKGGIIFNAVKYKLNGIIDYMVLSEAELMEKKKDPYW